MTAPSPSPSLQHGFPAPTTTPRWCGVVAKLPYRDPDTEWYRPEDLAPLLGIDPKSVCHHLRQLWPKHRGQWRLSHEEAVRVIKRAVFAGKKLPKTP